MPDGEGAGVVVEAAGVDELVGAAVAGGAASFFAGDPESPVSPDGGFILLE